MSLISLPEHVEGIVVLDRVVIAGAEIIHSFPVLLSAPI